jgi:formate hydrogenlyase transcriptional activator
LEEVRGWRWARSVHAEDREAFVAKWRHALATGEPFEAESRVRRADGQYRWLLHRKVALRDANGTIVKWYGSSIDIEDRKLAEECARQQERQVRQIVDLVPHHIAVVAPDGTGLYGNQIMLDYYGLKLEEITGLVIQRFAHPDDVDTFIRTWQRGLSGTAAWETEARFRRRDGEYRWFLTRSTPLFDDAGRIVRWYATGTDIDDRKKAEDKVREQERELREMLDLVPHHIVVTAPDRTRLYANHVMLDYYGLTIDDLRSPDFRGMVVHSGDRQAFAASLERGFAGTDPWETEARFRGSDGDYRSFLVRGTPLRDDRGRTVRWYITGTDIDDRKKAEEKIRQDERELRTIVDSLPQLLVVADAQSGVMYANRAALEFTGLSLEEAVVHPDVWAEIVHPDDLPTVRANIRAIAEGIVSEAEIRLRRPDGQYRWILARNAPLRDAEDRVIGWFAVGTDIDSRKRAEQRTRDENLALREEVDRASMFEEIVGHSPAIQAVLGRVAKVAPTESTVLITGETGTGKELIARAIHKRSRRSERAFVSVNCAAIPQTLITSELFGHEKGAFTGALQRRLGRFELAEGGTLFLDEVGELPSETQLALLRVLQEREFERVGGTKPIHADVRVVAATNRDLQAAIAAGTFRSDLFYRLNVFPIDVPALCGRKEDIPVLVAYFVDRYASRTGKRITTISKDSMELLQSYPWPGNIRELQNVIERSLIVCDTDTFAVDESWLAPGTLSRRPPRHEANKVAAQTEERVTIEAALAETKGRVSGPRGAAGKLRLPASTLEAKIRSLGINKHRFKTI